MNVASKMVYGRINDLFEIDIIGCIIAVGHALQMRSSGGFGKG